MRSIPVAALLALAAGACAAKDGRENAGMGVERGSAREAVATFGAGCFWCVEAVFDRIEGVLSVESGYSGGALENPTYREVCTGETGHAEVCRIRYDPARVSYADLLEVFFRMHDPTTPDRQGADVGPQYRSVIFYHDETQRELAEKAKAELDAAGLFGAPIVTRIEPFRRFWRAEDHHQDYYAQHPEAGYCRTVIHPKLAHLFPGSGTTVDDTR